LDRPLLSVSKAATRFVRAVARAASWGATGLPPVADPLAVSRKAAVAGDVSHSELCPRLRV